MTNRIQPSALVAAMIDAASTAQRVEDLPAPGTFANRYGEAVKGDITGDNVQAFVDGTVVVNLLVQEVLVRVMQGAQDTLRIAGQSDPECATYVEGIHDGIVAVTMLMSQLADGTVQALIEDGLIDRAFEGIVKGF